MKTLLALSLLLVATACVSNQEFDRDRAYAKCESISDKSSRDRCIADAIKRAERERAPTPVPRSLSRLPCRAYRLDPQPCDPAP